MYSNYNETKYKNVSKEEFYKALKYCQEVFPMQVEEKYDIWRNARLEAGLSKKEYNKLYPSFATYYFKIGITKAYLTYKDDKWISIYYDLNCPEGGQLSRERNGGESYRYLQQYAHIPSLKGEYGYKEVIEDGKKKVKWNIKNIMPSPYSSNNIELDKPYKCYYYDMHRAFLNACKGLFPDTLGFKDNILTPIKENQVGFNEDGKPIYKVGEVCLYVFDLIEIPGLSKWANKMEELILEAKNEPDNKQKIFNLKHEYTDAIGMMCRHNPFVHNVIVDNCMKIMEGYIDDNTLYSVTDSIISTVERKDLPLGIHTGEFERDYMDTDIYFVRTAAGYQIVNKEGDTLKNKNRGSRVDNNTDKEKDDLYNIIENPLIMAGSYREKERAINVFKYNHLWTGLDKLYKEDLASFKLQEIIIELNHTVLGQRKDYVDQLLDKYNEETAKEKLLETIRLAKETIRLTNNEWLMDEYIVKWNDKVKKENRIWISHEREEEARK